MNKTVIALALLSVCSLANAHFGSVIPNKQIVSDPKDSTLTITTAFNHPMEQTGMTMEKPKSFSVIVDGKKTDLTNTLQKTKVLDKDAWMTQYRVARPGCYKFVLEPQPYWEPAEDKFIIHYSKVMVPVFGVDDGWDAPTGAKTEILPLTRPFGNYAGNVFRGQVILNGKPAPDTMVEVEYYNVDHRVKAPDDIFITQQVKTDKNGIFSYAVPWEGWWGFAALNDADYKIKKDGQDKDVELDLVIKSNNGDVDARNKLILHNLRLVVFLAKKYDNTNETLEDLVSIGSIGLIKGINTYKPDKNIKLATYASRCIENEILMFLRKNKKRNTEISFEDSINFDGEGNELHLEDVFGTDPELIPKAYEDKIDKIILLKEIEKLGDRDKEIIKMRYGLMGSEEYTQKEVADMLGISQSYISRIEKKTIKKLQNLMKV